FVENEVLPFVDEWEEAGAFPKDLHRRAYEAGVYGAFWPEKYGGTFPNAEEADMFHYFIFYDELARPCASGLYGSLLTHSISLPPVLELGSEKQKEAIARQVITGQKTCCLAVTEPGGGSDVANVQTTAVLDASGQHYVVNGQKTFISGGMNADYFTTGVRTSGKTGSKGISLLLVPRSSDGLNTARLQTQGWHLSTTTLVTFDEVKVPAENLLGGEGDGFLAIMRNFNNERLALAITANREARVCLEEAAKYAQVRKTFGKPLSSHQVIRHKLMECGRLVMATNAMILSVCAQKPRPSDSSEQLAGAIALAKVQATKSFEFVARECSQVFGGKSYLRSGPGHVVERAYREVRVLAVGGGSEEIMLDLASRQARL
ncbi:AFT10-1, partial [Symbiodinium pilosum]